MRLLNTNTVQITEFREDEVPPYAILSHTWSVVEATFYDMKGARGAEKGIYEKIYNSCSIAAADGFEYIWIDTCCIDKTSSAELSEAINSMYRWYQEAEVCYAYLADVPSSHIINSVAGHISSRFSRSKWFTRGWTLQELIAPRTVIFLDRDWYKIGTKSDLRQIISNITSIPNSILLDGDLEQCSIAQKMSWAANRNTSRVEDRAYCLMGIFGINMPLIYGEGKRAFIRLQEEIMKISDDQSLFAWKSKEENHGGLLATSPAAFKESGNIVVSNSFNISENPMTISNRGIHLELRFIGVGHRGLGLAILNCAEIGKDSLLAIYLRDVFLTMKQFERDWTDKFELLDQRTITLSHYTVRTIYVRQRRLTRSKDDGGHMLKPRIEEQNTALEEIHLHSNSKEFGGMKILIDISEQTPLFRTLSDIETNLKDEDVQTLLLHGAGEGHETVVKLLLARGDVVADLKDKDGRTPLSHAAGGGHEAVVKLLLARDDVDADSKDKKGRTPLSHAAGGGHEAVAWLLLTQNNVEANSRDVDGEMPLSHAARGGHKVLMKILLARSDTKSYSIDDMGRGVLSYAAERGQDALIKLLLTQSDIQLDFRDKADLKDIRGRTPLSYATQNGHEEIVKLLLESGAKLEAADSDGRTPLSYAAGDKHEGIIKLFLKYGVKIDAADYGGRTPLSFATWEGHESIVKLLLENGADLEATDINGRRPLSYAAGNGHKATVKLLLENGADQWAIDKDGKKPLSYAAENGHNAIVELLLDKQHDIGMRR
ncbi:hypothetical protein B7463_g9114, partial [Scytalidium lignicola]